MYISILILTMVCQSILHTLSARKVEDKALLDGQLVVYSKIKLKSSLSVILYWDPHSYYKVNYGMVFNLTHVFSNNGGLILKININARLGLAQKTSQLMTQLMFGKVCGNSPLGA